jgi:hypothetical protein
MRYFVVHLAPWVQYSHSPSFFVSSFLLFTPEKSH